MAVIWFYLSNIDRLDIFFDTVSLSSAIGIIFVFLICLFYTFEVSVKLWGLYFVWSVLL